ncbi:MAG: DUF2279 domain-containing protein, partial [Winogradskyella sp.]|nr:DUF2279 domain-containing protein [Winogradskyella sp.]
MQKKHLVLFFICGCLSQLIIGQGSEFSVLRPSDSLHKKRQKTVILSQISMTAASLIALDQLWYKDYQRSGFRFTDDSNDWLRMDKAGHVFSSYQLGRLSGDAYKWSGSSKKNQLIYGSMYGLAFLTTVEIMDGFSEEWGFSWTDMLANSLGTGLLVGQELLWEDQRLVLKYSFSRTQYAQQRPERLGEGIYEEFLKDYNGQTYWLSANINSFLKYAKFPNWLNLALGYGADGMLTGSPEDANFANQNRVRQFYLSFDVDLSRIKTNSHFLKTIFSLLNVIKIPLPT